MLDSLIRLWPFGTWIIVWGQSASLQIETSKLHGNVHFGFDSRNHLTFIVQSLHVFFPSMVCVIPGSRPCGYYALWMIKLLTAARANSSRMYVFFCFFVEHPRGCWYAFWNELWNLNRCWPILGKVVLHFVLLVQDWAFSGTAFLEKWMMWVDTTTGVLLHWAFIYIFLFGTCSGLAEHDVGLTLGVNHWRLLPVLLLCIHL